jgi:hypothetical protein
MAKQQSPGMPDEDKSLRPGKDKDKASSDRDDNGSSQGSRTTENLVLAGFFIVLVAAGVWLLGTMADVRKVQDCAAQGRRNCQTIEVPERSR